MTVRKTLYKKKGGTKNNKKNPPASFLVKNKNNNLLMHKRNLHRSSFTNFEELGRSFPYINLFLEKNEAGKLFYDFRHSLSTYFLSKALLKQYYNIEFYLPYVYKIHHLVDFPFFCDQQKNGHEQKCVQLGEEKDKNTEQENKTEQLKEKFNIMYDKHNEKLNLLQSKKVFVSEKSQGKFYEEGDKKESVSKYEGSYSAAAANETKEQKIQEQKLKDQKKEQQKAEEQKTEEEDKFLCPCVPGRVNYIHILSDLATYNKNEANVKHSSNECKQYILSGSPVKVVDIGVGANCIYPLLGSNIYKWTFVGSDINWESLKIAYLNILINNQENNIKLKFQREKNKIFFSIIDKKNLFFFSMCNPPFYSDLEELNQNPHRYLDAKISEVLYTEVSKADIYNHEKKADALHTRAEFTKETESEGKEESVGRVERSISETNEQITLLSTPLSDETYFNSGNKFARTGKGRGKTGEGGGECSFILKMLQESTFFFYNIIWFTSLVSKLKNVKIIKQEIIKSMRSYITHGSNQISYLDSLIHNSVHFDKFFYFKNINDVTFPIFISQYRILKSYQGKITRWVICWSYFNEHQIDFLKHLYYSKCNT